VTELALNDVERYTFTSHLDRVRVAKLVGREAAPDPGADGEATQGAPGGCCGPWPPACRPVENADEGADGQLDLYLEPRIELLPGPAVHADFTSLATFA